VRKSERLTVKVMAAHKNALRTLAQIEGEPVAMIVRRLIRAEAERRNVWQESEKPCGREPRQ
jgi:hypothetical protein